MFADMFAASFSDVTETEDFSGNDEMASGNDEIQDDNEKVDDLEFQSHQKDENNELSEQSAMVEGEDEDEEIGDFFVPPPTFRQAQGIRWKK